MLIYIKEEFNQNLQVCKEIKNKLEVTTFKDIVKFSRIYYDPEDFNTNIKEDVLLVALYKQYKEMLGDECNAQESPWLLRMELDRTKMLEHGMTMIDLSTRLNDHFLDKIFCVFSDDNAESLIFRIKLIPSPNEKGTDTLTDLRALESTILETVTLKGIDKVNKVELIKKEGYKYDNATKVFNKVSEWCMDTDGTNLVEVLGNAFVDATRTVSNDVNEIYALLGIEAARQCLYNELYAVIKGADASVNYRHLSILVDTMTNKGSLMSIDRHGINKGDIGPLAKCSFEEVNDVLVKAGVFAEVDRVNGVSSNIILGQIAPCGTGDSDIFIDESMLNPPTEDQKKKREKAEGKDDCLDVYDESTRKEECSEENLTIDFAMPYLDPSIAPAHPQLAINVNFV